MTKNQQRDIRCATAALHCGNIGMAARIISAAIRCAMRQRDAQALRTWAAAHGVDRHHEFIA